MFLAYIWKKELDNRVRQKTHELENNDKMQRDFINVAAHELRRPTQSILGYLEITEKYPDNIKRYLEPLKRNSKRLSKLTEDIVDVARIESGTFKLSKEKFDLNEKIDNMIKDVTQIKDPISSQNIKFDFEHSKEPTFFFADKIRIFEVISNLLRNAIKFTDKGQITVTLDKEYNDSNEFAIVKIKDTGKGIQPEMIALLFKKFVTKSEFGGTGIGLYISKKIIEAHGGKIWGKNNENGIGAEFRSTLPIEENKK